MAEPIAFSRRAFDPIRKIYTSKYVVDQERQAGEDHPVALILYAGKKKETVEYLNLGEKGIHVAEYLTDLPDWKLLEQRFHAAVVRARERLAAQEHPAPPPKKKR